MAERADPRLIESSDIRGEADERYGPTEFRWVIARKSLGLGGTAHTRA